MTEPDRTTDKGPSGTLLTLRRGIMLLEAVAVAKGQATAKTLAAELGVKVGTCYQLIRTLHDQGYLSRLPQGRYRLGPRVRFLVDHFSADTQPPVDLTHGLEQLHATLGETCYLAMWQHEAITLVAALEGTRALRVGTIDVGYSEGAHARASCKALLAHVPADRVRDYFRQHEMTRYTPHTITDIDALLDELATTRKRGYGLDREEVDIDVANIAAPVFDQAGEPVAAYSVGLAAASVDSRLDEILTPLFATAERASRSLGYDGPYPPDAFHAKDRS